MSFTRFQLTLQAAVRNRHLDTLPATSTGKILANALRIPVAKGALRRGPLHFADKYLT